MLFSTSSGHSQVFLTGFSTLATSLLHLALTYTSLTTLPPNPPFVMSLGIILSWIPWRI